MPSGVTQVSVAGSAPLRSLEADADQSSRVWSTGPRLRGGHRGCHADAVAPDPPTPLQPVLAFESVWVTSEDGAELLRGVEAAVYPGSITVVAGPSGSGKTTLLRLG